MFHVEHYLNTTLIVLHNIPNVFGVEAFIL